MVVMERGQQREKWDELSSGSGREVAWWGLLLCLDLIYIFSWRHVDASAAPI